MNEPTLKSCPFCDSKAHTGCDTGDGAPMYFVCCEECGAVYESSSSEQRAIVGWNNRQNTEADDKISNLATLVKRLARRLNRVEPNNPIVEQAFDYLRRKDLQGSILRD